MKLTFQIKEAWLHLMSTKFRSFLAMLGIFIGTASVMAMLLGGKIATAQVINQFKQLGTNLMSLQLSPMTMNYGNSEKNSNNQPRITLQQLLNLQHIKGIDIVAPYKNSYRFIAFPNQTKKQMLATVSVTNQFNMINQLKMQQGRFINNSDTHNDNAVLGYQVYRKMKDYTFHNILGQQIEINKQFFTIIGIIAPTLTNPFFRQDINNSIFIPLKESSGNDNSSDHYDVLIRNSKNANIDQISQQLISKIKRQNPHQLIYLNTAKTLIAGMTKQKEIMTLFLGLIGSISLIVGGIGVMNIMLVSVVERYLEIGIRMAIGARRVDIQMLFLIEGMILSIIGGIVGILVGIIITYLIALFNHWQFELFFSPIVLSFSVSVITGIFFSWYPAFKASKVDPVICLNAE